ncbi:MAG: hypothetical protein U0R52_14380 [Solirubrobacterales bacterium]
MKRLRQALAREPDPYGGLDLALALRVGSVLWLVGLGIGSCCGR